MRRIVGGTLLAAAVVAAAGCRTPMRAGADYDPTMLIGQPATYAWNDPDGLPVGEPLLDDNPFFVTRLHGAVARELGARGIRMAVGNRPPTLLVHHHASIHNEVEVYPSEDMVTLTPYGPGTQVYQYQEGNFLIDILDAKTQKLVWRGWARMDLAGALDDPKALDELLGYAVGRMFGFFPIPKGELPVVEPPVEQEPPVIDPVPDPDPRYPRPDVAGSTFPPFPPQP